MIGAGLRCGIDDRKHAVTTCGGGDRSAVFQKFFATKEGYPGPIDEFSKIFLLVRVLSVASGHLRELDIVSTATSNRNVEILALDQDKDSLDEAVQSYPEFAIRPLNHSISHLFKSNGLEPF